MGQSAFGEEQQGAIKWTALRVACPVGAGMRGVRAPQVMCRWTGSDQTRGPQIGHDDTLFNERVIHVGSTYS